MTEETTVRRPRERSPNYPGVSLPAALERATALYRKERRNPAPVDVVLQHWGYSAASGQGLVTIAALKRFGLIDETGSGPARRLKVSEAAVRIALDTRDDSTERMALIQEAALRPAIHREVLERFGGTLPSDANLRHYLMFERGFSESGATDFIRQLRATMEFARLDESATLSVTEPEAAVTEHAENPKMSAAPLTPPGQPLAVGKAMQLPLAPNEYAVLQAPFPLTEAKWQQMLAVLTAMKPALVADPNPVSTDRDEGDQ